MLILDLLFPVSCLECKKGNEYFCATCLSKVKVLNHFYPYAQTFSIFRYQGVIRKGIIKLKYNFAFDVANKLTQVSLKAFSNPFIKKRIILVPIPLHPQRLNWRGFNQSAILADLFANKFNWQVKNDLLVRINQGKTQVGLNLSNRVRNMRGKFAVNPQAKIDPQAFYLVFDDVVTTGSTILEAIKVLKKAGAQKVFGLTLAK